MTKKTITTRRLVAVALAAAAALLVIGAPTAIGNVGADEPDALDRYLRNSPPELGSPERRAATGGGGTLRLIDVGDAFAFVDAEPKAQTEGDFGAGDVLLFDNELLDARDERAVGRFVSLCTIGARPGFALCRGTLSLPRGTIAVAALFDFSKPTIQAAVLGGTGRYAGAGGEMFLGEEVEGRRNVTIELES